MTYHPEIGPRQTVDRRQVDWLLSQDTGLSSTAIFEHMTGRSSNGDYPLDVDDFGRCYRLLERFPEWRVRMLEMVVYGKEWAALAGRWSDIEVWYRDFLKTRNWKRFQRSFDKVIAR